MKFLCENCKAKYQIADDKVAGRTVRMKCRKCSHMIEVEASVTETSVAASGPEDDRPKSTAASTGISPAKGAVQAVAAGLAPAPRAPAPPPRPMSPSLTGVRPRATPIPSPAVPPSSRPAKGAPPKAPAAGGAGLAGAFSKAVGSPPSEDPSAVSAAMAVLSSSSSSSEEWYVGINGVPVGPVRLSDLRRKAATGLITPESLVWREGFEEWVPLRTYPELAAMLKESAGAGRTSLTPTPSQANPTPPPRTHAPLPRGPASPAVGGIRPAGTPRAVAAQARSNVLAFAARGAAAEKIDGLHEPSVEDDVKVDESIRPPPGTASTEGAVEATVVPGGADLAAALAVPTSEPMQFRSAALSVRPSGRRTPLALWLVVALGGMLLGVFAMVLLLPKANSKVPAVQIVSVMVPAPPAPVAAPVENEGTTIGPIEVSAPVAGKAPGSGSKAKKGESTAEQPPSGAPAAPLSTSLTGLGGLVGGPTAPSGGGSSSSGGGQLQSADLERVVQSHRAFVKRQCWDPALGARAPNAPSSARVVVAISVGANGSVHNASATGGDGYAGLSNCVQGQVKNWKFPQSDGTTSFNVPFVFAAQ